MVIGAATTHASAIRTVPVVATVVPIVKWPAVKVSVTLSHGVTWSHVKLTLAT